MTAPAATCPICQRPVSAGSATAPFCCARCREVDLVRWADGKYAVRRELTGDDLAEIDPADLAPGSDVADDGG